ncbi:ABC transporter permease subunit [Myxococcota bacterium]|nr:ABC transporter permease subunit [Myxococcota bacterium]
MSARRVWVIFGKELVETLRDRRTLFVMILLPILLYPLIFMGLSFVMQAHISRLSQDEVRLALWAPPADAPALNAALGAPSDAQLKRYLLPRPSDQALCSTARDLLARREAHVILVKDGPDCRRETSTPRLAPGPLGRLELLYDGTDDLSQRGARAALELLKDHRRARLEAHLVAHGLDPRQAEPFSVERFNVASEARMGGYFAGQVIPLILVLMVILGAFYPAIDLTAGEKERGTLESLLCTPTTPLEMMLGKYLAVIVISMIAATMNLVSMSLTVRQMTASVEALGGAFTLGWAGALTILLLLLPTALLFSALMLALAAFARDFKEAQNYLTPAFMLAIVPAALSGLPGIKLNFFLGLVPGLNITLVIKEILVGEATAGGVALVIAVNLVYAALILRLAARLFASERVLFGAAKPWDLFSALGALRTPPLPGAMPSLGGAMLLYLALLALLFHAGAAAQAHDLFWGMLITQWGLLLLPVVLFVILGRFDLRATLSLRWPRPRAALGATLVGLSAWTLALGASALIERAVPDARDFASQMSEVINAGLADRSFIGVLFLFALSPAICEEALFRGALLSASRGLGRWGAIALNAALFGAFHMHLYRFAPTALLGALIAYVVWTSRSLLLGMLIHALSNGLVFTLHARPAWATWLGLGEVGSPWPLWVLAMLTPLGLWLVRGAKDQAK